MNLSRRGEPLCELGGDLLRLRRLVELPFGLLQPDFARLRACQTALECWYSACDEMAGRIEALAAGGTDVAALETDYVKLIIRVGQLQEALNLMYRPAAPRN